jgi:hypothetical protein
MASVWWLLCRGNGHCWRATRSFKTLHFLFESRWFLRRLSGSISKSILALDIIIINIKEHYLEYFKVIVN